MDLVDHTAPSTKSKLKNTRGIEAMTIDLRPLDNAEMEVESEEDCVIEQSKHTTALRMSRPLHASRYSWPCDYRG